MIIGEHYEANQLVFCDESAFNRISMRRPFAWSRIGTRARRRDFFVRGTRYLFSHPYLSANKTHMNFIVLDGLFFRQFRSMVYFTSGCTIIRSLVQSFSTSSRSCWTTCNLSHYQIPYSLLITHQYIKFRVSGRPLKHGEHRQHHSRISTI